MRSFPSSYKHVVIYLILKKEENSLPSSPFPLLYVIATKKLYDFPKGHIRIEVKTKNTRTRSPCPQALLSL